MCLAILIHFANEDALFHIILLKSITLRHVLNIVKWFQQNMFIVLFGEQSLLSHWHRVGIT